MKVLLIIGGQSTENEISRMSGKNIKKSINKVHDVTTVGITKEGKWYELVSEDYTTDKWLENAVEVNNIFTYLKNFDVVFPALHGKYGEDGSIQGLLELANVPYVGMKVLSSSISLDKVYTKLLLSNFNIKMVPYLYVRKKEDNSLVIINSDFTENNNILELVKEKFNYPVFVKAANQGSSVGCYKVLKEEELMDKLIKASYYDNKILIEKAINARELEVAVLGNDEVLVSDVGEILPHGDYYTYDSKYKDENSKIQIPADINENERSYIRNTAIKIFKILDGHGLSRCDFFLDKDSGNIYFNEINTMPGFTDISMYPMLTKYAGISCTKLIDTLLELAVKSK